MKRIWIVCLLLAGCSDDSTLNDQFDRFELSVQDNLTIGSVVLDANQKNATYSFEDNEDCNGSFDLTASQVNELREIIQGVPYSYQDGLEGDVRFGFYIDGDFFCTGSPCNKISESTFCEIQTFMKNLLEQSGENLTGCPENIYNYLLDC